MSKKILFAAILTLGTGLGFAAPAGDRGQASEPATEMVTTEMASDSETSAISGEWVNSTEVNTVQQSEIARKMKQAEKARNAAENDSFGGAITIIAMCIVLAALIVLSILFLCFGKISSAFLSKKKRQAHGLSKEDLTEDHEDVDSGEVIAAIATALNEHFSKRHDIEDTILTIRRMRKAYSPWNSKIYNMRELPELNRKAAKRAIPRASK